VRPSDFDRTQYFFRYPTPPLYSESIDFAALYKEFPAGTAVLSHRAQNAAAGNPRAAGKTLSRDRCARLAGAVLPAALA
jgi:hypothetical protein